MPHGGRDGDVGGFTQQEVPRAQERASRKEEKGGYERISRSGESWQKSVQRRKIQHKISERKKEKKKKGGGAQYKRRKGEVIKIEKGSSGKKTQGKAKRR